MSLPKLTEADLSKGATLICCESDKWFTRNCLYKVVDRVYNFCYVTYDNDNDLAEFSINRLSSNNYPAKFISYDRLSTEAKVLFQLHRDVDQL